MEGQRNEALPLGRQGRGETGNLALSAGRSFNLAPPISLILTKRDKEVARIIMIRSNSRRHYNLQVRDG